MKTREAASRDPRSLTEEKNGALQMLPSSSNCQWSFVTRCHHPESGGNNQVTDPLRLSSFSDDETMRMVWVMVLPVGMNGRGSG